jgi:hypothetical protein
MEGVAAVPTLVISNTKPISTSQCNRSRSPLKNSSHKQRVNHLPKMTRHHCSPVAVLPSRPSTPKLTNLTLSTQSTLKQPTRFNSNSLSIGKVLRTTTATTRLTFLCHPNSSIWTSRHPCNNGSSILTRVPSKSPTNTSRVPTSLRNSRSSNAANPSPTPRSKIKGEVM